MSGSYQLATFAARVEIEAVDALPWETESPVATHLSAEGIQHV